MVCWSADNYRCLCCPSTVWQASTGRVVFDLRKNSLTNIIACKQPKFYTSKSFSSLAQCAASLTQCVSGSISFIHLRETLVFGDVVGYETKQIFTLASSLSCVKDALVSCILMCELVVQQGPVWVKQMQGMESTVGQWPVRCHSPTSVPCPAWVLVLQIQ